MIDYINSGSLDNKIVITATMGDVSTHLNTVAFDALKIIGWDSSVNLFNLYKKIS